MTIARAENIISTGLEVPAHAVARLGPTVSNHNRLHNNLLLHYRNICTFPASVNALPVTDSSLRVSGIQTLWLKLRQDVSGTFTSVPNYPS